MSIRVGVLSTGTEIPEWAREGLEQLCDSLNAEIPLVVTRTPPEDIGTEPSGLISEILHHGPWALVLADLKLAHLLAGSTDRKGESVRLDEVDVLKKSTIVECTTEPADGLGVTVPARIVKRAREDLDLLVNFGFGIIKGDILDAPEHGILSVHSGDLRNYRGRPAGFWEFLENEPEVVITFQRLTETLDGGYVVATRSIDITGLVTWPEIRQRIVAEQPALLVDAVENVSDPSFSPDQPDELGQLYTRPGWWHSAECVVWNNWNRLRRTLRRPTP